MIGTTINERYQIDKELGRGGMGTVYRAHDITLDRDVAVKLISEATLSTEGHSRLLREAQTIAQLDHPNIVSVYDVGDHEGNPYIVMQLAEGGSLHERRPESLDDTLSIVKQVCAALEHAHQQGVVHRDLKPENVAVSEDGTAKLMDFGLARSVASRMTTEGNIVGTVFYMAPEQAMGQELDARADLYALGVMLYELTTGELPFVDDNPVAVISQHVNAPVVPPRAKKEDLPQFLDKLILQLLEKDPQDRPPSAAVVLEILETPEDAERSQDDWKELSVLDRIVRGRIVGRGEEYEEARSSWREAATGAGQTLLISGEPGIGKTRLMREVVTQAEVLGGQAFVGEAYEENNIPYGAFSQIVRNALNKQTENGFTLSDLVLDDVLNLAPDLRPNYPDIEPNPKLDPESEQARLLENMVAFCDALSKDAPLLLVLDDAHWADSSSIALFLHLARRTRRQSMMLLATYREVELREARPFNEMLLELNRQRIGIRIKLSRLNEDQTGDMLATIFNDEVTPEFLEGIYRETDGNPFFIEEVCRALVESGKLYFEAGEWHQPSIEELEIPQGVQIAVESRLTKLPEQVQETLRMAAVLGREFDYEVLIEASDLDEEAIIDAIEIADKAQMVQEGREDTLYEFVHALVPQSIRENTHRLRLRKLHGRAAAAYEAAQPENYESLAYHHGEGGNNDQALRNYALAAQRAMDNFANQDAENLLLDALELVKDPDMRAELYQYLGRVLSRLDRPEEAVSVYRDGIAIYQDLKDLENVAKLYALAVRTSPAGADALAISQEGLKAVEGLKEGPGLAHLLERSASAHIFSGEFEVGLRYADRALEMSRKFDIVAVQVEALNTLSIAVQREDKLKGFSLLQEAVDLAEQHNLWREAIRAHGNLAGATDDDRPLKRKHFDRAIELARMMGLTYQELMLWTNSVSWALWMGDLRFGLQELPKIKDELHKVTDLGIQMPSVSYVEGDILRFKGDLEAALPSYMHALETFKEMGNKLVYHNTIGATAWLFIEMGQPNHLDQALDLLQASIEIEPSYAIHLALFVQLYIKKRNLQEAQRYLEKAQAAYEDNPSPFDQYWAFLTRSQLLGANEHWDSAWAAYQETADLPVLNEYPWFVADTFRLWANAHLARGETDDHARARDLLDKALIIFGDMGATGYVEKVEAQIENLN